MSSACGEGMDWMIRSMVSVFAASVLYFLPSLAIIFSCTILSYNSVYHSVLLSFIFRSLQYLLEFEDLESIETISMMEKSRSSRISSR